MNKTYIIDRLLHWTAAVALLFMLVNLSSLLHNMDWQVMGQIEHRQSAVETHTLVGVLLLTLTLVRVIHSCFAKDDVTRITPRSARHQLFITATHIALYSCIILLALTGLLMVANYDIPITVVGITLNTVNESFYQTFPAIHNVHMVLKDIIWWLIAIHFFGVMAAKK